MKKMICLLLAALLLACAAAGAFAEEEVPAFRVATPSGAPALALAVLAADSPENYYQELYWSDFGRAARQYLSSYGIL